MVGIDDAITSLTTKMKAYAEAGPCAFIVLVLTNREEGIHGESYLHVDLATVAAEPTGPLGHEAVGDLAAEVLDELGERTRTN